MILSANKSRKEAGTMATLFFTEVQSREIIKDAGHIGLLLMERYVAISHQTNPYMEDDHLSTMLDLPLRTVERTRLALTKTGWFRRIKNTHKGELQLTYLIGKDAVQQQRFAILIK